MTQSSGPWEGSTVGDASAAPYSSLEWSSYWSKILGWGVGANRGVIRGTGDGINLPLAVIADGVSKNLVVKAGIAVVQGRLFISDADVSVTIPDNSSGLGRIDTVVLQMDNTAQTIRVANKSGTPAASPVHPNLTQSGSIWEIPLADVVVANAFASLAQSTVTQYDDPANNGDEIILDDVINNSGGILQTGDVVIWDSAGTRQVKTTTSVNDERIAGVWVGYTANGAKGRVLRKGLGWIKLNWNGISRGNTAGAAVITSGTAKVAQVVQTDVATIAGINSLGYQLGPLSSGTNTVLAYIDVRLLGIEYMQFHQVALVGGHYGGLAATTWTKRTLAQKSGRLIRGCSVASGEVTLPPGDYLIHAWAQGYKVDNHAIRLFSVTAVAELEGGSSEVAGAGISVQSKSELWSHQFLTSNTTLRLEHNCSTANATDGQGHDPHVFQVATGMAAFMEIWRMPGIWST